MKTSATSKEPNKPQTVQIEDLAPKSVEAVRGGAVRLQDVHFVMTSNR